MTKSLKILLLFPIIFQVSIQIHVPDENVNQKPVTYTSGINTRNYGVSYHHNYSQVRHFSKNPVHTYGQRPPNEIYVLNGSIIRKTENPTRRILIYNKQKRSPKLESYNSCPRNATGQFVYESSCNQFLNCWKGRGHVQNCAPGTLFNPKSLECDFPYKVACISGPRQSILQKERSARPVRQVGCPKEFSGLIPNYTDCSKFINCVSGIENLMDCPPGTLFDINKNICDFPHKASCFNGQNVNLVAQNIDGKLDFQSGSGRTHENLKYRQGGEIKCPHGANGLYPHPTDCSRFLNCANGVTYIQDCSPGTLYNPAVKICDFPYNVRCQNGSGAGYYASSTERYRPSTPINRYDQTYYGNRETGGQETGTDRYGYQGSVGNEQGYYGNRETGYGSSTKAAGYYGNRETGHGSAVKGATYYGTGYGSSVKGSNNYFNQETLPGSGYYDNQRGETGYGSSTDRTGYYGNQRGDYGNRETGYGGSTDRTGYYGNQRGDYGNRETGYGSSTDRTGYYGNRGNQETNYGYATQYRPNTQYGSTNQGSSTNEYYGNGQTSYGSSRPNTYDSNQYRPNQGGYGINQSGYSRPNTQGSGYDVNQSGYYGSSISPENGYGGGSVNQYRPGNGYGGSVNQYRPGSSVDTGNSYGTSANQYGPGSSISPENGYGTSVNQYRPGNEYGGSENQYRPGNGYGGSVDTGNYYGSRPSEQGYYGSNTHHTQTTPHRPTYYQKPTNQYGNTGFTVIPDSRPQYNRDQNTESTWSNQRPTGTYARPEPYIPTNHRPWRDDDEPTTANYDQVVNINHHTRKTTPFRNQYEPFFGPTTSKSNDYDDTFRPGHTNKFIRATTPTIIIEKNWPPPFPSTDVNADYVFDYDDAEVSLEAENSVRDEDCGKSHFRCSNEKCIPKTLVCNGIQDCPNGQDEQRCLEYVSKFSIRKNTKLAILEKERWDNVSIATCALLCVQAQKLRCRSFNYRKVDKTCLLTNTNEGLTGGLISYHPFDYYELISEKVNCTFMHVCANKKCISKARICDGQDDCGDRMDEKGCKPENFGYSIRLADSKNRNEGHIQVTAFGKTGYICDDNFGLRDAEVACKELGFHLGALEVKKNSFFAKNFSINKPFYMMDDITCLGNETKLMDCDFSGWGVHNCLGQEIVGVVCKTPQERCPDDYWQCDTGQECLPLGFVCDGLLDCTDGSDEGSQHCDAPTELRLVNGTSQSSGRLEIRYHGIWGTVCDDDFNEDAAKVVCKQLGYTGSGFVRKDGHFGGGTGPIWLDQVFCSGNETDLQSCTHWNWGEHNCEHGEDVGVVCSNVYETERHSMSPLPRLPQEYPERCGFRKDAIFTRNDDVHFRVVKGSVARRGDYPWQAAVRVKGKSSTGHWCGAVIIGEKFVLTAAHCLIGYAKGAYVIVAGDYNVDDDEGTEQVAYIEDFYIHEDFRQGHKMNNDIALVKLKGRGFRFNDDVQPICLPDPGTSYETDQNCTISGFGSIESGKSAFSHDLRAGWVPLQRREVCKMPHVYGDAMTEGMVCAGSLDEGVDSCDGDSGGPLACLNQGVFTLYGITSWGQHCGYANKPGVYVKVAHYRKWIDDNFYKHSAA